MDRQRQTDRDHVLQHHLSRPCLRETTTAYTSGLQPLHWAPLEPLQPSTTTTTATTTTAAAATTTATAAAAAAGATTTTASATTRPTTATTTVC